jgi:hypothetical protein
MLYEDNRLLFVCDNFTCPTFFSLCLHCRYDQMMTNRGHSAVNTVLNAALRLDGKTVKTDFFDRRAGRAVCGSILR